MTTAKRTPFKRKTQPAGTILLAALGERWGNYRVQIKTCRREFSQEAVHDLRVAARRILAVLDIARALDPHPRVQKARRFLKDQLDDLDDLRDVQVMMVDVAESIGELPEIKYFQAHLQEQEKRLLRLARRQIRNLKPSELDRRIEKISDSLKKRSQGNQFPAQLLQVVDNAYLRSIQALGQVDALQSGTIHRLRLAFKKFRYMVEIVQPLFANYPEFHPKRMHDYQSAMGDIQDLETLLNALADFSGSGAVSFDANPIRRFYEKRHEETISAFLEDKGEIVTFWRAAPDQPFSWEKNHDPVSHPSRHRRGGGKVRGKRQRAAADQQGPQEDALDRPSTEGIGGSDRPDPDQPLPALDPDGPNPEDSV